jgi:hypothetical protein
MFKVGDRVTINWDTVYNEDLDKIEYEVSNFNDLIECYGTVKRDYNSDDGYVIIEWDTKYHNRMYDNNQWNLSFKIVKLVEPVDPKKAIERRIKRTYAKSKLPFVRNWSK